MSTSIHRRQVLRFAGLVVGAAALLGACGGRNSRAGAPVPIPAPPQVEEVDPVAASQLREQALVLLAAAARAEDAQTRANALEGMAPARARLEPFLREALMDANVGVRSTAVILIGRYKIASLVPVIRPLTQDPSPYVRSGAIYALNANGQFADPTPLAAMLLRDPSVNVRRHVTDLIGAMGDPSARGLLRQAARVDLPRVRPADVRLLQLQIAEALVRLGDEDQVEAIRAALYPSRPEELEATALAVQILGQLNDRGSIDNLILLTAAQDPSGQKMPAEVRLAAASSLARMGLRQGSFIADEFAADRNPAIRAQAAHVYGMTRHAENLPKLKGMLGDPAAQVRVAAATAIIRITSAPAP